MNAVELYAVTPPERHNEIVISGDRLYFEDEVYVIEESGELRLVCSSGTLRDRLNTIETLLRP